MRLNTTQAFVLLALLSFLFWLPLGIWIAS